MKGWRTVILNGLVALFGAGATVIADAPIKPETAGIVLAVLGAVNMFLRSITNTPMGKSEA